MPAKPGWYFSQSRFLEWSWWRTKDRAELSILYEISIYTTPYTKKVCVLCTSRMLTYLHVVKQNNISLLLCSTLAPDLTHERPTVEGRSPMKLPVDHPSLIHGCAMPWSAMLHPLLAKMEIYHKSRRRLKAWRRERKGKERNEESKKRTEWMDGKGFSSVWLTCPTKPRLLHFNLLYSTSIPTTTIVLWATTIPISISISAWSGRRVGRGNSVNE